MGEKKRKVYQALVDGATEGLSGIQLYNFILVRCPETSSKKIVRAALLALTDDDVKDPHVLDAIYALAIKHRTDPIGANDDHDDEDDHVDTPSLKKIGKAKG